MTRLPHTRRRVITLAVLIALAVALAASDAVHERLEDVLARVAVIIDAHPRMGLALFVVVSALSAMLAFFSSAIFVPVAVYAWGDVTTAILLWLSWLAGGSCSYLIGRTFGRRMLSWFVAPERIDYYAARIASRERFVTVLLFQIALPSEIPGYVLGTVRYRFPLYLAALAIAELPFALGAVYLGDSFVHQKLMMLIAIGLAGLAFSVFAFHHLHRRIGAG